MIDKHSRPHPSLEIRISNTREDLGRAAAADIAMAIRRKLEEQSQLRMIFAAAPSQIEMLRYLVDEKGVDWDRVTGFHMDEYIGLPESAPQRFGTWLRRAIFDRVSFAEVHLINPGNDPDATCRFYTEKLTEKPIDLVLLGIGVNGHLAFNDPPANLEDPALVRVVALDEICRQQQVDDGCFNSIDEVPRMAVTLTVPMLLRGHQLFCCVPGSRKKSSVRNMVYDPISGDFPATALRKHSRCTVYLDVDSSSELA